MGQGDTPSQPLEEPVASLQGAPLSGKPRGILHLTFCCRADPKAGFHSGEGKPACLAGRPVFLRALCGLCCDCPPWACVGVALSWRSWNRPGLLI